MLELPPEYLQYFFNKQAPLNYLNHFGNMNDVLSHGMPGNNGIEDLDRYRQIPSSMPKSEAFTNLKEDWDMIYRMRGLPSSGSNYRMPNKSKNETSADFLNRVLRGKGNLYNL
jgi:hypothetical protein